MGDGASSPNKTIVPITAAVMAVGSVGFMFYHLSDLTAKRLDERAYQKEKLSLQRDLLDCVSAVVKHHIIGPEVDKKKW